MKSSYEKLRQRLRLWSPKKVFSGGSNHEAPLSAPWPAVKELPKAGMKPGEFVVRKKRTPAI